MKAINRQRRQQSGFGMIEILVAMLVLAIGVMGFAGLQARAVQTSGDSYYRSQAMSLAQDLAERVRANSRQTAAYRTAANWPADNAAVTSAPTTCVDAACTPANMVIFDVNSVRYNVQTLLPQGEIRMEACQASSVNCIYVAWDGLTATAGAAGECVGTTGEYKSPPANRPALTCLMLEVL